MEKSLVVIGSSTDGSVAVFLPGLKRATCPTALVFC
jgi:hypothetical protein